MDNYISKHAFLGNKDFYRSRSFAKLSSKINSTSLLVSAPAGYGKSTFIKNWLKNQSVQWDWLNLDGYDNDIDTFIHRLITVIQKNANSLEPAKIDSIAFSKNKSIAELSKKFLSVINELDNEQIIVLDNYEHISNEDISKFIESTIAHLPANVRFILISRTKLNFPIDDWKSAGKINCLETADFILDFEETEAFIKELYTQELDWNSMNFIQKKTEGWIMGIKLLAESSKNFKNIKLLEDSESYHIDNYFLYEVINKQTEFIKSVLFVTALFDKFSNSMIQKIIDQVLNEKNGYDKDNNYLENIQQNNLFVIHPSINKQWFHYHNLFRTFLLQLSNQRIGIEDMNRIYFIAAEWYQENNLIKEALQSYLLGGHYKAAKELVISVHLRLFEKEKWATLDNYLKLFSIEQQKESIELLIIKGWIHRMRGNREKLLGVLSEIENTKSFFPIESKLFRGELLLLKSIKLIHKVDDFQKLQYLIKALAILPTNAGFFRSWGLSLKFFAYLLNGDNYRGVNVIKDAHRESNSVEPYFKCRLYQSEAMGYLLKNDLTNLQKTAQYLKQVALKNNLNASAASSSFLLMVYYYQSGDFQKVKETYLDLLEHNFSAELSMMLQANYIRSIVFLEEGEEKKALELMVDSEMMCKRENNHQLSIYAKYFSLDIQYRAGIKIHPAMMEEDFLSLTPHLVFEPYLPHLIIIKLILASGTSEHLEVAKRLLVIVKNWISKTKIEFVKMDYLILKAILQHKLLEPVKAKEKLGEALKLADEQGIVRVLQNYKMELTPICGKVLNNEFKSSFKLNDLYNDIKGISKPIDKIPKTENMLTNREIDVLELLTFRFSNKEIAEKLFIEPSSVKRHTIRIYKKINVNSRQKAVARAYELNLLA